jgi:arginase family enzyme
MQIAINNTDDLIKVIKRDNISTSEANVITSKALGAIIIHEFEKDVLIDKIINHIKLRKENEEAPIFLGLDLDCFDITEIYKNDSTV